MARLAGRALREAGAGELVVANRTPATGTALARELGGRAVPLDQVAGELAMADLAVAATAGPAPTVTAATVADALARRSDTGSAGPLVLLDLGVPRDVEPEVRGLGGVVLADLDALRAVLETDEGPRREVERVRALIARETAAYLRDRREARLTPTIRALRDRAEEVRLLELAKASARLAGLDAQQRAAVEAVTRGLVNKLLHDPMVRGKSLAARPDGDLYVAALRELYGLDPRPGDDDRR
jgi:glutamyl-tRNA reductase